MIAPATNFSFIQEVSFRCFQKGQLYLFDARGKNNQCHLVALMIAALYQRYQSDQKSLLPTDLSFIQMTFLSSNFFCYPNKNILSQLHLDKAEKLLKNEQIIKTSAAQLAAEVHRFTTAQLCPVGSNPLYAELSQMSQEPNLYADERSRLICYPKFAGVLVMLKSLETEVQIPVILKIKVLCAKGVHIQCYMASTVKSAFIMVAQTTAQSAALIIEGFANRGIFSSFADYKEKRTHCSHSFFAKKKEEKHSCTLCLPCSDASCADLMRHQMEFSKRSLTGEELLKRAAADFTSVAQPFFVSRFFSQAKYPTISKIFNESLQQAQKEGLSCENALLLGVEHVYADNLQHALKTDRLLDQSPESILAKENLS